MDEPKVHVSRVLPRTGDGTLTADEARAILAIGYMTGEADARVADEEEDAFVELAHALQGLVGANDAKMADGALDTMLESLEERIDKNGRDTALAEVVRELGRPLVRELAYKVSVAMSVADLDRSDAEADFDDELLAALGFTEEQASLLTEDVYSALEQ
jgi:hypothetical protein